MSKFFSESRPQHATAVDDQTNDHVTIRSLPTALVLDTAENRDRIPPEAAKWYYDGEIKDVLLRQYPTFCTGPREVFKKTLHNNEADLWYQELADI